MKLILRHKKGLFTFGLEVYDEYDSLKYIVKVSGEKDFRRFAVYDVDKSEIANLYEKPFGFTKQFEAEKYGENIGIIKIKLGFLNLEMGWESKGWMTLVEGGKFSNEVKQGEKVVFFYGYEKSKLGIYNMTFDNPEDEIEVLLFMLAFYEGMKRR